MIQTCRPGREVGVVTKVFVKISVTKVGAFTEKSIFLIKEASTAKLSGTIAPSVLFLPGNHLPVLRLRNRFSAFSRDCAAGSTRALQGSKVGL